MVPKAISNCMEVYNLLQLTSIQFPLTALEFTDVLTWTLGEI